MQTTAQPSFRIVVLLSGRGSNFIAIHKHLTKHAPQASIVGVVSDRNKAPALSYASENNIPQSIVKRDAKIKSLDQFSEELADVVSSYQPDLVVLAGFMRLVSRPFINTFQNKALNIHPSLLPSFPGLEPQKQALDCGVTISGCTVHVVTEEMDSGPIIAQAAVPVLPNDTVDSLSARILEQEHRIYPKVVELFASGQLKIEKSEGNQSRIEIERSHLADSALSLSNLTCR